MTRWLPSLRVTSHPSINYSNLLKDLTPYPSPGLNFWAKTAQDRMNSCFFSLPKFKVKVSESNMGRKVNQ